MMRYETPAMVLKEPEHEPAIRLTVWVLAVEELDYVCYWSLRASCDTELILVRGGES